MANVKGLIIAGVTVVAAVGVYYGLNMTMPHVEEKGALPSTASLDQVYSGTISEAEPAPGAPASATAANAPAPPTVPGTPPPAQPAPAQQQASAEPAKAEAPTTTTPPPAAQVAAAETPPQPKASEPTAKPAEPLLVPEPAAPATPPPAAPKAQPKAEPRPAPKAEPAPAPTPAPAPAPAPKPEAPPKPAAAPKQPTPPPSTAGAATRWWGDPAHQNPAQLNVSFAGQAAGEKAIALMFTGGFINPGVANKIKVLSADGHTANGHWELSPNPKMLLFRGVAAGRYTLVLSPDLKDAQGKALGRKLSGPVNVQ